MPVEVMSTDTAMADSGDAVTHQRCDIRASAARGDFACADAFEQFAYRAHLFHGFVLRGLWQSTARSETEAPRMLGASVHFDGRYVIADLVTHPVAVCLCS